MTVHSCAQIKSKSRVDLARSLLYPRLMKNFVTWIVATLALAVIAMVGIHAWENQQVRTQVSQIERIAERKETVAKMQLEMEKYRRTNGTFRKLTDQEIAQIKNHLKSEITKGAELLEKLDQDGSDKATLAHVGTKLAELMEVSAKLEPQLFSRDVYQKPQIREIHDAMVDSLKKLDYGMETEINATKAKIEALEAWSLRLLILLAAVTIGLTVLIILRNLVSHARPLRKLRDRAMSLRSGRFVAGAQTTKGAYGEVEGVINDLALAVESHRKERHQFVTAVAGDLKAPLVSLQAGAALIGSVGDKLDPQLRKQATDAIARSVFRLSRSLDDLNDIVEMDRADLRLDEKIVDVRDLIASVANSLGGAGSTHPVALSLPAAPIWTLLDSQRFERVIVNLISKISNHLPQGGRIDVAIEKVGQGSFRGLEIVIQDGSRAQGGKSFAGGPEQDLLKHWVSENGFGLALAQKIMRAHGGSISASGIAGTGLMFIVRIPAERLSSGMLQSSAASIGLGAGFLESPGIKAVLSEQSVQIRPGLGSET